MRRSTTLTAKFTTVEGTDKCKFVVNERGCKDFLQRKLEKIMAAYRKHEELNRYGCLNIHLTTDKFV